MHIFKENLYIFYQNRPKNVTKLNVFFKCCVFNSTVHQQQYIAEFLGGGGGGGVRKHSSEVSKIWL